MPFACSATEDFFRSRIDHMIDLRHPLAVLASRMPWQQIEASAAGVFSRKGRTGQALPDLRPGMEGVGKITTAEQPLGWILGHKLLDWLRLQLWNWMP